MKITRRTALGGLGAGMLAAAWPGRLCGKDAPPGRIAFPFKKGDHVAWIGSSSTKIGVWPRTVEFLLSTRHPELKLTFVRLTTGGGTFETGLKNLDGYLEQNKPTVVVFNFGGNDAGAGEKGLPKFRERIAACMAKLGAAGVRGLFTTHQASDVRKSGAEAAQRRTLYAENLLAFAAEKGWPCVDVNHPLAELQRAGQADDDSFTILKDKIHLTEPAYVAWGYFFYERIAPPPAVSRLELSAAGEVRREERCKATAVSAAGGRLSFERADAVSPVLPPAALPPAKLVPLVALSPYELAVAGLADGTYEVRCEGASLGTARAAELAKGVNLNGLLLASGRPAPWAEHAKKWWDGKDRDAVGRTRSRFEVRPAP
jgi:lysophospholipase L1-like esterase